MKIRKGDYILVNGRIEAVAIKDSPSFEGERISIGVSSYEEPRVPIYEAIPARDHVMVKIDFFPAYDFGPVRVLATSARQKEQLFLAQGYFAPIEQDGRITAREALKAIQSMPVILKKYRLPNPLQFGQFPSIDAFDRWSEYCTSILSDDAQDEARDLKREAANTLKAATR